MRTSRYLLATVKETPADAVIASHRLMIRAGLIRQNSSGIYTWLPTGMRVLAKAEAIVREEMNRAGAIEIAMPMVQPAELWQESGRYTKYGPELCRFKDRKFNDYVLGPTHEEVVTDIARREIKSARQLPVCLYQIQNKFRDEIRPRFGIMRTREFVMKDAYSFDLDQKGLEKAYWIMYEAYNRIFTRMGLTFRPVVADNGAIGGKFSHEFQALAEAGEDLIAWSDSSDYAANIEMAACVPPAESRRAPTLELTRAPTPGCHTVDEAAAALKLPAPQVLKSLVVRSAPADDGSYELIMLCLSGNQQLNEVKAAKIAGVANPIEFASFEEIAEKTGAHPGSLGPVGFKGRIIVDLTAGVMSDFACGANEDGYHFTGVNWDRDVKNYELADLRNIEDGDPSPDGKGTVHLRRGIEVGQVFMLGTRYSEDMGACVTADSGEKIPLKMGCYGIGVTRAIAAVIEQNHDDSGIIWPEVLAPFTVAIVAIRLHDSKAVAETAEKLYKELTDKGVEVLFDDRDERPGVMFADMELIGIPHIITVGDKALSRGCIEYKNRRSGAREDLPLEGACAAVMDKISASLA